MEWWHPVVAGVVLAVVVAVGKWAVRNIVTGVVEDLDKRLGLDEVRRNINPGAAGWPNGSDTLPETLVELYGRQSQTHSAQVEAKERAAQVEAKVDDVLAQLEQLITG